MPSNSQSTKSSGTSKSQSKNNNAASGDKSNPAIVKEGGWTNRANFQHSYGLGMGMCLNSFALVEETVD